MHFVENEEWNWETLEDSNQASNQQKLNFHVGSVKGQRNQDWKNEIVDNIPVRGTRLFYDIYHRYNIAVCEPTSFEKAKMDGSNEGGVTHDREKQDMLACQQTSR